jgi:hypothetical protein
LLSGASTLAEQQSQTTHLSTIASGVDGVEGLLAALTGTVSGTELQVDVVTMPTTTVQDGGGSLTVDNAGTFAVQAAQSGTWNITNVSGTVSLPTGAATAAKQPALGTAGTASADVITVQGIASMTPLAVSDNGSTLSVDDGGGVLTVDGTVAVTDNAGSLTVDAPVGTPVFVRLSDGASAISTLPVSLATVPSHAVTNAGTFAVQVDGAALTALQLIDNPVVVDDAAFTPATTSVMMVGFEYDDTSPDNVHEGDAGAARMSSRRELYVQVRDAAGNERGLNVDASGNIGVSSIASALPAGTNAIGKLAANTGVDIGDVDVTSVVPGTSATSLGKAVDAAAGASDVGVSILAVRDDALTTLTPADGDYVPLRTTSTGALWVEATAQGHEYLEDAAHTSGDYGSLILGVRNDSSLTNVAGADGDYTFLATDALGRVQTTRRQPIVLTWTPTLDTSAYASGDSLYTTVTTLSNAHFRNGGTLMVDTITVLDKSTPSGANNPAPIDILFFSASVTPSTVNTASGISDADMANCIGFVSVAQYTTNSANSFGQRTNIGLPLKLGASTTSLYVACIVRGTPTYASDSLVFTLYGYPDA